MWFQENAKDEKKEIENKIEVGTGNINGVIFQAITREKRI
jgi:hypothetical protein